MNRNHYFRIKNRQYRMLLAFQKYLDAKGAQVMNEEDEATIIFEKDKLYFLFVYDKDDPFYFRLILPNVAEITDENRVKVLDVINNKNREFKAVKAVVIDNKIWILAEQFAYSKENLDELFERLIKILTVYMTKLNEKLRVQDGEKIAE